VAPSAAAPASSPSDGPRLASGAGAQLPRRGAARAPKLHLRARPARVTVLIDGVIAGRTPLSLTSPGGPFVVEARRAGYSAWRRRFEALTADRRLTMTLARRAVGVGFLTVNSIPWARVFVDGRAVGTTPIRRLRLRVGSHRVLLRDGRGRSIRSFVARIVKGRARVFSFDRSKQR